VLHGLLALLGVALALALGDPVQADEDAKTAAGAPKVLPQDAFWVLTLGTGGTENRALLLHLDLEGGVVRAAFVTGFNNMPVEADHSGLKLEGNRLQGAVKFTLVADPWIPRDGKPIPCNYTLDVAAADATAKGAYQGTAGAQACAGTVTGRLEPKPGTQLFRRFKLRCYWPLLRLCGKIGPKGPSGVNANYALDMYLSFNMENGRCSQGALESIVPDYRRYCALVEKLQFKLEGSRLTGAVVALVDTGQQGTGAKDAPRRETYTYTYNGWVIGDVAAGMFESKVGELEHKDHRFMGKVSFAPPPKPAESTAWLRLHNAMEGEAPVLLNLSLPTRGPIHGYSYCPGFNHQPQSLDASGLKLEGNRLRGLVKVSIFPDCYKPPEFFSMEHTVDAEISGYEIAGTFTGRDRGQDFKGPVVGELRAKSSPQPVVAQDTVATCEVTVNGLKALYTCQQGQITRLEVTDPANPNMTAEVLGVPELRLQGDRLTGALAFTRTSGQETKGKFEYTFEGILDGLKVSGLWRGKKDGEWILTKSAKLHGAVTKAE